MDALEFCKGLASSSVACVFTSPPYNLADPMRPGRTGAGVYHRYAGSEEGVGDGTLKPEPVYQQEQVAVLTELHRALVDDGVLFYSHKVRIKDGAAISPLAWIFKTPFVFFQELVWDRGGTQQQQDWRFLPVSERIYVLTKKAGLHLHNPTRMGDVLRIPPNHHKRDESGHPCPTHPAIVRACLSTVPASETRRLCVDPYGGSGTTGQIAREFGMDYLLNDRAAEYVALMEKNLSAPHLVPLFTEDGGAGRSSPPPTDEEVEAAA